MHFDFAQYKQRGFVPILIVIAVAALVGGYFVYTNSQTKTPAPTIQPSPKSSDASGAPNGATETTTWKTYTNYDFRYTLKYPETWEVKDITKEEIWYPEKIGRPYPYGEGSYITLQNFYERKYNDKVLSIITLVAPDDINPVVPKKGPGDMWISGVRLEVRDSDKNYISSYREDIKNLQFEEKEINGWTIFEFKQSHYGNDKTSVFAAFIRNNDKYFKLTNDGLGTRAGNEIIDSILYSFKFTQ